MPQYLKVQGAYFQQTPQGLSAVNDQATLRGLQSGQIKATEQGNLGAAPVSQTVATPMIPPTISSQNLSGSQAPVQVPQYNERPIPTYAELQQMFAQPTAEQTAARNEETGLLGTVEEILNKQGTKGQRKGELENQAGIPQLGAQLNEINNQIRGINASAFNETMRSENRQAPTFAILGEQAAIERQKSAQTFGLAAASQALQGNIALAQDNVQRALDAEFGGLESQLEFSKLLLDRNRDRLNRADSNRTKALEFALGERERLLTEQRQDKQSVYDVMSIASKYQAPTAVLNKILASRNPGEALLAAGSYLQDPKAKIELEGAVLKNQLTKIEMAKAQQELNTFKQYGGLTPAQWADAREKELKAFQENGQKLSLAKKTNIELDKNKTQVQAILNSDALSTVVGPNILARGSLRQKGLVSTALGSVAGLATFGGLSGGAAQEISGSADDFVALTEQLLSQQFLDKIIEVKGQGATFGALTDREGNALRTAANAIANSKIESGGKTVGYDMSESEFKKQLGIVLGAIEYAREQNEGTVFSSDEEDFFNSVESLQFDPSY